MTVGKQSVPAFDPPSGGPEERDDGDDGQEDKSPERRPKRGFKPELRGSQLRSMEPLVADPEEKRASERSKEDCGAL